MANQVLRALGTPITFQDSGGTTAITLANLGFGAGRVSARHDRGAGSQPLEFEWRAIMQFETAPIVGEIVEIWLFQSDGTYADGVIGTSDAALTSDARRNGLLIGRVVAQSTSTATDNIASGLCKISSRYFSVGVWNGSAGDNLENTSNANKIIFTPIPYEVQ